MCSLYHRPVSVSADMDRPMIYEVPSPKKFCEGNFARGLRTQEAAAMLSRGFGAAQSIKLSTNSGGPACVVGGAAVNEAVGEQWGLQEPQSTKLSANSGGSKKILFSLSSFCFLVVCLYGQSHARVRRSVARTALGWCSGEW